MFKVSVIVPVYNTEKYISRCIDSILNQTYKNIEIILVNDGSTDNSQSIIDSYVSRYENIKSIIQKNGRQGTARNNGIKISTGEFIMFVDSDDYIFQYSIDTLVKIIKEGNIAIGTMAEDNNGIINPVEYVSSILLKAEKSKLKNLKELKESWKLSSSCHKLFRKSFLVDNNIYFPERMVWEDGPFNLKAWLQCDNISYINKLVYCRTIRSENDNKSTIQTINKSIIMDDIKSHTISIELCKEYNQKELIEDLIKGFYLSNLNRCKKLPINNQKIYMEVELYKNKWLDNIKEDIGFYRYIRMKILLQLAKLYINYKYRGEI